MATQIPRRSRRAHIHIHTCKHAHHNYFIINKTKAKEQGTECNKANQINSKQWKIVSVCVCGCVICRQTSRMQIASYKRYLHVSLCVLVQVTFMIPHIYIYICMCVCVTVDDRFSV